MAGEKEIGKVIHYFDRAGVVVVALSGGLSVGARIKIVRGDSEFEETIGSMQVDHEQVQSGKKGDEVAIKVSQPAKEGSRIYIVE